jgi:F-type H+-transporting ATPase subunit b
MEALGINIPGLLSQTINFVILLVLLYVLLYKPILRMLDQRSVRIRESLEEAERVRQQAQQAQADFQVQIEQARREGQEIVTQATRIGEQLKEDARREARTQAEQILERARTEITAERDQAISELRREFADLTIAAAGRVINTSLDKRAHMDLIDQVLSESVTFREKS